MKKSIFIWIILLVAVLIVGFTMAKIRSTKAQPQTYYKINTQNDGSSLQIGMIGDSWASIASQYNFNNYLDSLLYQNHIKSETHIKGNPGAKTKSIYLNLFSNDSTESFKYIIEKRLSYCIVTCGINDLYGQYGEEYYKHNLLLIIKALLHYNIKPIIIEIPYFFIQEQYKTYSFTRQSAYQILSLINSHNLQIDNFLCYREAIVTALKKEQLWDKIIYISTDSILKNNRNLYTDNMHINKRGYHLLGDIIVQQITSDIDNILP